MRRSHLLVLTCGCAAAIVLLKCSAPASLVLNFLVGKLFYSTSDGAALFFLSWLAVSCLAAAAVSGKQGPEAPENQPRPALDRLMSAALPAVVLAGQGVNLLSFFFYAARIGLPLRLHFYHWRGEENSYCYLLHNHTGKLALDRGLNLLGLDSLGKGYDTGQVFAGHVPAVFPALVGLLLLLSLAAYFFLLPAILRRHRFHGLVFFLYVYASAGCLKTMVDGGPLTYRFLPSFLVLVAVCFARDLQHLQTAFRKQARLIGLALVLYLLLWKALSPDDFLLTLGSFNFLLLFYLLLVLLLYPPPNRRRWVRQAAVVACLGLVLAGYAFEYSVSLRPFFARIDEHWTVARMDPVSLRLEDVTRESMGLRVHEVYRQYGNDPRKPRDLLVAGKGEPDCSGFLFVLKPLEVAGSVGGFPDSRLLRVRDLRPSPVVAGGLQVSLEVRESMPAIFCAEGDALTRNNYYCCLHLIGAFLGRAGLPEFVLFPVSPLPETPPAHTVPAGLAPDLSGLISQLLRPAGCASLSEFFGFPGSTA